MVTSSSWDFSLTAAQLIARAAKNLGILQAGGTINTNDQTDLLETLNIIAKQFQGTSDMSPGMKVHTRQRVVLFLAKGQQTYTVGPAATDARATTQYGRTTLSAAYTSGTSISITSNTDTTTFPGTTVTMTASDIIGIKLTDGTIHWTTISGTPGATATLAAGASSAAASGNYVWWFTSRAQRFPNIEGAVLRNENLSDTELGVYIRATGYDQGVVDKYADGQPTTILVEPLRLNTRVTLNSQPTDVSSQIVLTVLYPSEDYDATTNDIAYPQEWLGFLEWELTLRGCPMFGKTFTPEMQLNHKRAEAMARSLNPETSDLYFKCNA